MEVQVNNNDFSRLKRIFHPESMAIIGASDSPAKFGGIFMATNLGYGFKGKLYPVNPKGGEIQGHKSYASVEDIPGPVDLAVITVPSQYVLETVRSCARKGVLGAQILTAGFREAGPLGVILEKEVVRVAKEGNVRLIGPNCFGLHSPKAGLTLMPGLDFSKTPGKVGVISQSGGGACDLAYMSLGMNTHFSVMISMGNACDINAAEMLEYFADDDDTEIVGAYIEGVTDGRDFFKSLKACAQKKPVVILKGGLSEQGPRGTLGHTGSMAGTKEAWEAAIKSAGAIPARNMRDLNECLAAFSCLAGFTGGGAAIMAGGGLRCVDGLDAASAYNFRVPEVDADTESRIQAYLPPAGGKGGNPADLARPSIEPEVINPVMDILAEKEDINFLVLYQMLFYAINGLRNREKQTGQKLPRLEGTQEIIDHALKLRETTGKPLAVILPPIASSPKHIEMELGRMEARSLYTANGIPCFDTGLQAFSVLRRVADYYKS